MENVGFVNLTAGLADPSVLNTPPMGCENAPLIQAHYVSTVNIQVRLEICTANLAPSQAKEIEECDKNNI